MFGTLGVAFERLGQLDRAENLLKRATAQRAQQFGTRSNDYARSLMGLGQLRQDQSCLTEAEQYLRQAVSR